MPEKLRSRLVVVLALLALATPAGADEISVTWLGHATFEIVSPGGTTLLIDPFLSQNPITPADRKDPQSYEPDAILLTHSHFDHVADAVAIAGASGAKVVGTYEHVSGLQLPQEQQLGGNPGGKFAIGDVTVHFVPAMHGSGPDGRPVGFIVEFSDDRSLYHTGDTWIFGDMALIQEIHAPDIILLQAGGGPYNQDPATAKLAIEKYFDPEVIVPMHYGTFPVLAQEEDVRAAFEGDERVRILEPGVAVKL